MPGGRAGRTGRRNGAASALRPAFGVLAYAVVATAAFALAFLLRFDFRVTPFWWARALEALPILLAARLGAVLWLGIESELWGYAGIEDLVPLLKAATAGSLLLLVGTVVLLDHIPPRSVVLLDWLAFLFLAGALRVAPRLYRRIAPRGGRAAARRAIVVGAGDAGELLLRMARESRPQSHEIVGFVDDDPGKLHAYIHGVPVLGHVEQVAEICRDRGADEVILAVPSATAEQRRRILTFCRAARVPVKSIPPLQDILTGRLAVGHLQEVEPEDLLGREPVRFDAGLVREQVAGRTVLVTGAAGSIGSEICRQLAPLGPGRLVLLDQAESNLYFLCMELRRAHPDLALEAVVGSVLDRDHLGEVMRAHSPEIVYHAAAYKHVPLMEAQPLSAIQNNVFGTEAVARAAVGSGVRRAVLVSTDKAVSPVGVMGMTKRVAEGVVRTLNGGPTLFAAVRFGNVLGSDGSVLPLLRRQIATGGPVTITDPDATRYFMLIGEAAMLVLQAGAMAQANEVFFLDMGEPVRVAEMANDLIRLSGHEPGRDIEVVRTGLRPGERLTEALVGEGEELLPTGNDRVQVVRTRPIDAGSFREDLEALRALVAARDEAGALELLGKMASEY